MFTVGVDKSMARILSFGHIYSNSKYSFVTFKILAVTFTFRSYRI